MRNYSLEIQINQISKIGESAGKYLNLSFANLRYVSLSFANLRGADLRRANLGYVDLRGANLGYADLRYVSLSGADLRGANLRRADLSGADLRGANLSGADLSGADLSGANLSGANLGTADPSFPPVPVTDLSAFETYADDPDFIVGYRTRKSRYFGNTVYEVGNEYVAPIFSTLEYVACHFGIYLAPTREHSSLDGNADLVKVVALRAETLKAGDKYRTKRVLVIE